MTITLSMRLLVWPATMFILLALIIAPGAAIQLNPIGSTTTEAVTIAQGDPVTITGIATGQPREGLQVWVIGKNYLDISTIQVESDNSFTFELRSSDTLSLTPGQYYVVIQHPMMNGQFDIYYDPSTGRVINRQLGTDGLGIYQMTGSGSLQGPASAQALVNAISSQNVDDSLTTYTFTIMPPSAFVEPVSDHVVGDRFTIGGYTNLAAGDKLQVEITSSSFGPTQKTSQGGFSGASGVVTVVPGSGGYNRWSFDVDASSFAPDEYIVIVTGVTVDVTGTTTFLITEPSQKTPVTTEPVQPAITTGYTTVSTQAAVPQAAMPTTARSPGFTGIAALATCAAAALFFRTAR